MYIRYKLRYIRVVYNTICTYNIRESRLIRISLRVTLQRLLLMLAGGASGYAAAPARIATYGSEAITHTLSSGLFALPSETIPPRRIKNVPERIKRKTNRNGRNVPQGLLKKNSSFKFAWLVVLTLYCVYVSLLTVNLLINFTPGVRFYAQIFKIYLKPIPIHEIFCVFFPHWSRISKLILLLDCDLCAN